MILRGGLVDLGGGRFERADVAVDGGFIAAVGDAGPGEGFDARRYLVVPGLTNAHTHSNESWLRGRFDNLPLDIWLVLAYPPLFAPRQTPDEIYLRTALSAMDAVHAGATSVVDFLYELAGLTEESLAAVVRAYRDVGVRALICLAIADRSFYEWSACEVGLLPDDARAELDRVPPPDAAEWLALARELVGRFHRPEEGIAIGLAPGGPHRCTEELLLAARELADELDLQLHTHTLETRRQATTIEHLERIGFLSERVHLCHGTWLTPADIDRLGGSGASVVHNPLSNLKLGSGVAPVPELLRHGIPLALGTDGTCSADGQDILAAVRLAALVHKRHDEPYEGWIGAQEAWAMATAGGAHATGDERVGRIDPGAHADLALFDLEHRAFTPLGDPLLHVGLGAPSPAVRHVLVGGRWIVRDGELTGVDEPALLAAARAAAPPLLARHEKGFAFGEALVPSVAAAWHRDLVGT